MNAGTSTSQVSPRGRGGPILAAAVRLFPENSHGYRRRASLRVWLSGYGGWMAIVTAQPAGASE